MLKIKIIIISLNFVTHPVFDANIFGAMEKKVSPVTG